MSAPAVAVSADGSKFAAAWKDVRTGEPNVYWTFSDKPVFADAQLVHGETRGVQDHPSLCFDDSGTAWVAWEDGRSGKSQIWIRSSRGGDSERPLTSPGSVAAPTVAAAAGLVAVAYESHSKEFSTVLFQICSSQP